ncbi:MAG TPA: diaminopimelate epimerase [Streptosporangiaceae bacterium]|nr:diaminopimelate epimerase [Streptosporangiaceae bacterium]
MRFVKGHGTENDFVVLPDPDGAIELTPDLVAALCDRRAGIGADGVLRVVRAKASRDPAGESQADAAEWFMDYRNADGSLAEMCGNGIRVYARYLIDAGLAAPGAWPVATRAGLRTVTAPAAGDVSVDMGPPEIIGPGAAEIAGRTYPGLRVSMGNPHLACAIGEPVSGLDLSRPPRVDPGAFPEGVNVEFYRSAGPHAITMRVYERGSGETRSCGTGAVAAAAAAAVEAAGAPGGEWTVAVPGGTVTVTFDGVTSHLRGPAVLVAEGEIHPDRLLRR